MASFTCSGPCKKTKNAVFLASGENSLCISCRTACRNQELSSGYVASTQNFNNVSIEKYCMHCTRYGHYAIQCPIKVQTYADDHRAEDEEHREWERKKDLCTERHADRQFLRDRR